MKRKRIYLLIFGILLVFLFSFVFDIGYRVDNDKSHFYGFPAEWLGLYTDGTYGFMGLGLLFNIALFYLVCLILFEIFKSILSRVKKHFTSLKRS
ncbi:hypothetical protein [Rummeliibacillus pycnus]|uniref:hypothetical protein n=1 Tax=Rummeliibacillus pycnus TaxID=101070 RepID=UPI000C99DDD4|nr:hypothetical protein [Rummeliibacillus pycnus]